MSLANNKYYTLVVVLIIYWLATFISLKGMSWVCKVAKIGGMVGTIIPAGLLSILGTVSYTHLDVYKRQLRTGLLSNVPPAEWKPTEEDKQEKAGAN